MERPVGLMILIAILAVWLDIAWLAGVMVVGIILILIASIEIRKPSPVPAGGGGKEILTPVVIQDIGEPPYLYPPNFDLKYNPKESLMPNYMIGGQALGSLVRMVVRTVKGDTYSYRGGGKSPIKKPKWRD